MPYIQKKLQEYGISSPNKFNHAHTHLKLKNLDQKHNHPSPPNSTPKLNKKGIKCIQQIVRSILYYARAIDMTVLTALSTIAIEQTKAMEMTMGQCMQLLDYLASNQEAQVRFHALDMIMNIHSNLSYLFEKGVQSCACGLFGGAGCQKMGSQ
jgi:hypothetical protein